MHRSDLTRTPAIPTPGTGTHAQAFDPLREGTEPAAR
jgi:hypothetical protein